MKKTYLVLAVLFAAFFALLFFSFKKTVHNPEQTLVETIIPTFSPKVISTPSPTTFPTLIPKEKTSANLSETIILDIPFTVQAPNHDWKNPILQNACEEASVLMVMKWAQDKPLIKTEVLKEINALSDFSEQEYGFHLDQSADDVARLIKDYYKHQNVRVEKNISADDIRKELYKGNAVLAPVNGQKLKNPFFTQPGPERHMLVFKGYDPDKKEFITNDEGIGRGNGYRYPEAVIENSLRSYPSGYHLPITETRKVMIVIGKN